MRRRGHFALAAVGMVAMVALALSACGSQQSSISKEKLKIGVVLALSGPAGAFGTASLAGTEIAVGEINKSGGILGRQVELVVRDDAGDPTKSRTSTEELVEKEKVAFIVGPTNSSQALAVQPYLTEKKVANIGSFAAAAAIDPKTFPYAFTNAPNNSFMALTISDYAANNLKVSKIALLAEATALGKEVQGLLQPLFEAKKVPLVAVEEYKVADLDYTAQLRKVKSAGAEALIIWSGNATDFVRFIKNLQSMGWDVPVLGPSSLTDPAVVAGAGADGLKKAYAQTARSLSFPSGKTLPQKTADFREKLRAKLNGENPIKSSLVLTSAFYDSMYLVREAANKANSMEGDKLKGVLESLQQWPGVFATWTYTPTMHMGLGEDDGTMVLPASCNDGACEKAPNAP
ncbi:MAG: hypothetical protein EPO21_11175 [Chloroflexota bacterium]|nr:MAG: hypothetical protein EPO21_11175 [Chloroflexota bacterium]